MHRLGIDVGGTFTDVVLINEDTGEASIAKILNREKRLAETLIEGIHRVLKASGCSADQIRWISHGTTITTNTVIERRGAIMALVTNEGFRDILEIGRFTRPQELIYRIYNEKPPPLVPRHLRLTVECRVDKTGTVLKDLDPEKIRQLASVLRSEGVESVAVCFLFSFLNPAHEKQVGAELSSACPGLEIVLSSDIIPEFREFPRMSTTVFAGYVAPVLRRYIEELIAQLKKNEVNAPLYIFQSNGGVAQTNVVLKNPAFTLLSGPAGAVVGAALLCGKAGFNNIITMDIGGTSLDVCLVREGQAEVTTGQEIDFFPVALPMIDVHSIGAGGGSIISVDEVGRVRVGPRSMGADPGPACYGLGGDTPTLTDVNLLLGHLDPAYFAGGEVSLYPEKAERAVADKVASPLGIEVRKSAQGVYKVAISQIADAIRVVTVERGYDPRDFALVGFGGGGPVYAASVARELGIGTVVIPRYPGLFSARGIANADFSHDYVQSVLAPLKKLTPQKLTEAFRSLEEQGREDLTAEDIPKDRQYLAKSLDLRYIGQTTEINVPLPDDLESLGKDLKGVAGNFHQRHEQSYTYSVPDEPIEVVNLRLKAIGEIDKPDLPTLPPGSGTSALEDRRPVWFAGEIDFISTPVYQRENLLPGVNFHGPAIIQESSSTTVIPPGIRVSVDIYDNMILHLAEGG
jgi:N-methylhydantoinase A